MCTRIQHRVGLLPGERARNGPAVRLHRAADGDGAQLLAVGDLGGAQRQRALRTGRQLGLHRQDNGDGVVLIVGGSGDVDLHLGGLAHLGRIVHKAEAQDTLADRTCTVQHTGIICHAAQRRRAALRDQAAQVHGAVVVVHGGAVHRSVAIGRPVDGEIHHLIRELQRIVVRLEAAAVRQRQSAPGNGVAARVRACVTLQSAAEGGGLAVHRTGGGIGQHGLIRAVGLALTGIRRHRDDSGGNGGHRRSLLAAGRQPIVARGRAAQRQAGDTDGPVRAHVLAVESTIGGNGEFIAFRLAADDRPADIQHGVSVAVVGLIRRRDAADSDGPGRDGEALRHRAERIVAHGRDGHGAARADISVLAIGDGVIPPLGQLGIADLYGRRRRDLPAGIGGVAAQRHRRRGLIGRDGERPAVVRQVCGGIVVLALRHVDPDVVRAHIGGLLHLDAVPIVLHRDAAHARNTGPGRHLRSLGAAVIGQRIGRGEGEVPCLRDSLPDGIGHAGGLAAHGDAGGVGARINGRCGQGAAVLLIGDLAHVRRRPPGLGQSGRLGAAVVDQSAAGRRDGDAAAVGIAAEPVRIAALGADGRAVAAQRIAPGVLMAPQHHGLALVDAADGVLAGGPADKAARLDPVGIFRGSDDHRAAGGGCVFRLDGDAAGIVQLAHHGDGPARAEIHILVGIDRTGHVQRAEVVYGVLTAGGGERAVGSDRALAGVV